MTLDDVKKRVEDIHESCGCVFCDLGLDPDNSINGRAVHMHRDRGVGYTVCTHDEITPQAASSTVLP